MTRKDCEKKISEKLKEIWKIYQKYNPNGTYINCCLMVCEDGLKVEASNEYWEADQHQPIQFEERSA